MGFFVALGVAVELVLLGDDPDPEDGAWVGVGDGEVVGGSVTTAG